MTPQSRRWLVTGLGTGLYFSFTFAWNGLAALMPNILADLQLSSLATGVLLSTVAGVIALTWVVMGPAVDRVGPSAAMAVGVGALGVAGIARAVAGGFPGLFVAMVVVALGGSTVTYGLPRAISSWFPTDEAGTPLGIVTVGAQLGTVAAFGSMQTFASALGGWRRALLVSGLPAVAFAGLWLWLGGRGPHYEPAAPPGLAAVRRFFGRPEVLALVLAGATYLFATHSVFGWLATLLVRRGFAEGTAAHLVAVLTAGQIVGTVGMPVLSDVTGRRAPFVALAGAAFGVAVAGFGVLEPTLAAFGVGCAVAGVAIGSVSPLLRVLPLELVPQGSVSTVVSMVFGVGALGGFLGPVLVGAAAAEVSLFWVFGLLALPGPVLVVVGVLFAGMEEH